jgi:hypothetical protein
MKKILNEGNQLHNFMSSSGSGTVINYRSGSDFLTSYGSGSTRQKVTVPTVLVPQRWPFLSVYFLLFPDCGEPERDGGGHPGQQEALTQHRLTRLDSPSESGR